MLKNEQHSSPLVDSATMSGQIRPIQLMNTDILISEFLTIDDDWLMIND